MGVERSPCGHRASRVCGGCACRCSALEQFGRRTDCGGTEFRRSAVRESAFRRNCVVEMVPFSAAVVVHRQRSCHQHSLGVVDRAVGTPWAAVCCRHHQHAGSGSAGRTSTREASVDLPSNTCRWLCLRGDGRAHRCELGRVCGDVWGRHLVAPKSRVGIVASTRSDAPHPARFSNFCRARRGEGLRPDGGEVDQRGSDRARSCSQTWCLVVR